MSVALVVVGDGRVQYLRQCIASVREYMPRVAHRIMVNDAGVAAYAAQLEREFGDEWKVVSHPQRMGMAAAVNTAWRTALQTDAEYVFHLEEDFTFNGPVPLAGMQKLLEQHPQLAQVCLRRQPWNDEEKSHGHLFGDNPGYLQHDGWIRNQVIFSLNPCLIPRAICERGWPPGNEAEQTVLLRQAGLAMAHWGRKEDPPDVTHVGHVRGDGWKL